MLVNPSTSELASLPLCIVLFHTTFAKKKNTKPEQKKKTEAKTFWFPMICSFFLFLVCCEYFFGNVCVCVLVTTSYVSDMPAKVHEDDFISPLIWCYTQWNHIFDFSFLLVSIPWVEFHFHICVLTSPVDILLVCMVDPVLVYFRIVVAVVVLILGARKTVSKKFVKTSRRWHENFCVIQTIWRCQSGVCPHVKL